jgi:hypothetical protein
VTKARVPAAVCGDSLLDLHRCIQFPGHVDNGEPHHCSCGSEWYGSFGDPGFQVYLRRDADYWHGVSGAKP